MITRFNLKSFGAGLVAATAASGLAACASASVRPAGTVAALAPMRQLQSDPALRTRAPLPAQDADGAVRVAGKPDSDSDREAYRVHAGDQKVDIVLAQPEIRLQGEQRQRRRAPSKKAHLDARAHELDIAQNKAVLVELEGAEQTLAALVARGEATASNEAAAASGQQDADERRDAERTALATFIARQPTAWQQSPNDLLQASVSGSGLVVTIAGFAVFR